MSELDICIKIGNVWYSYWINNPDKEDFIFNDSKSILEMMSFVYHRLLSHKKITALENLDEQSKKNLKLEAKRIDPFHDVKKGMQIVKTISVFYYVSEN